MKTIPIAILAEVQESLATLAEFMRVERRDGRVFGFTTHDALVHYNGVDYVPQWGLNATDVASGSNMDTDNLTVEGLLNDDAITEEDLRVGRWDYAEVRIFQLNYENTSHGEIKVRKGHFGQVQVHASSFSVEILGLVEALGTSICDLTSPGCRTSLGSALCKVAPTIVTGVIDSFDDDLGTLHDSARSEATDFFTEGKITFLDGDAAGLEFEIKEYAPGVFVTKLQIQYDVTGASYSMEEGCLRTLDACASRSNVDNFRGEPHIRGNDALVQVGRHT